MIVSPAQSAVISLPPAVITLQDGHAKQNCEQAAAKRWIASATEIFKAQAVTPLGDDQVKTIERQQRKGKTDEIWQYRYLNDVSLRAEAPVLPVNWGELAVIRPSDGKVLYRNSWVTNHPLTLARVIEVAAAGCCRWKTENENHNVLKIKGYHLEHNFGHGKQHLSAFLLTLNLLAFLFHTILHLVDERYQQIRQIRGTRKGFFQDILALTNYLWFESWTALLDFMLDETKPAKPMGNNSS